MKPVDYLHAGKRRAAAIVRVLGAPRVEALLVVAASIAVFSATLLHLRFGRAHSQWFVYDTLWFRSLLLFLAASLGCRLSCRQTWNARSIGFTLGRVGLLAVLAGSFLDYASGLQGEIIVAKGESADRLALSDHFQITAAWSGRPNDPPYVFAFESGPVDWPAGRHVNLGRIDGMQARVLNFFQRGKLVETWRPDEQRVGGPLVRFRLESPGGGDPVEHFLVDQDFGAELFVGPIALRLQRAESDAMLADFLNPADRELGEHGLLTMYYGEHVQQAAIDDNAGKTIPLGDSGVGVEIVHYLAEARLDHEGKFQPTGDVPRNPLVELLVHVPNETTPFRQVAFAKSPLLNLDGVYERVCPVKFVYQHPKIEPAPAIELLQSGDGRLFGRTTARGQRKAVGQVTTGTRLEIADGFAWTVTEYLPHVRRHVSFQSAAELANDEAFQPAAHVEITAAGETNAVWLQRHHPELHQAAVETPHGRLHVRFGNAEIPLGFSIQLIDSYGEVDLPRRQNKMQASSVRLLDPETRVDHQREISLSRPLKHKGFTIYQGPSREAGHGKHVATFSASYKPGWRLKLAGALAICLGSVIACYARADSSTVRALPATDDNAAAA